ncbi:hypothetical protein [Bradyrhizobium algeriense]|uniref:hypothetical protein n=1 Tax=Bradyrhizobium algeriense TaxID=634784 RepID=UPI0011AE350E|nr:hypothetical protein [Bradyrhizobium algeriense]
MLINVDRPVKTCGATLVRPFLLAGEEIERLRLLMVDGVAKAFLSHPSQISRRAAAAIEY